jgi:hypothetical protein
MGLHEALSRLKMSRRNRFLLRSKNKDSLERLSSGLGKKDELSTTNNGSTNSHQQIIRIVVECISRGWFCQASLKGVGEDLKTEIVC